MKLRTHLLALAASATLAATALAAEQPAATSDSPETDASLYGQSVTLPRQAAVCAERIADYMPRFQKVFDASHTSSTGIVPFGRSAGVMRGSTGTLSRNGVRRSSRAPSTRGTQRISAFR